MDSRLSQRLSAHFAACAAALTVGAAVRPADAAVVYSGAVNIVIPSTTAGVYLDVVTGVNSATPFASYDVNPWSSSALNMFEPTNNPGGGHVVGPGATTTYLNLAVGAVIGPASSWTTSTGTSTLDGSTPLNLNSTNNYVGFRFVNEGNGNAVHYGWMRISLSASAGSQPRSIVEYAYEDVAGTAITVPAPASAALLGLGALGFARRRRS